MVNKGDTSERIVDIRIRSVPESLRIRFKTVCSGRGKTYGEMLKFLLDRVFPEIKWG